MELERLVERCLDLACDRYAERPGPLLALDRERELSPDWFQRPTAVGYACYADRFAGTLAGVRRRLAYLEELGVTYLHLLPLLRPRPGECDGGYAVADHREVDPRLGTMDDLEALAADLRARGMSLCLDLVLNHVAREHEWARRARAGEGRYLAYFWTFEDRTEPDRYEECLVDALPATSPGNFTFDLDSRRWVWTTFHDYQWDLRWETPEVFLEHADLVLALANRGAEVIRLDAVAFIWKRLGTSCRNQPEAHAVVRALRALARIAAPAVVFKAEAIVEPEELGAYLGLGQHRGKVSDLAYHNALMVQVWSALALGDCRPLARALGRVPPKPPTTAWVTYLRCHDDVGWAVSDGDARDLGLDGAAHRRLLADFYAGRLPASWARGADCQRDPRTGERTTSGTLASLAGLEAAVESGDEGLVALAIERILCAHALIFSWDGVPLLFMGDELGLDNDRGYLPDPARAGDNRWMHRPAMPWDRAELRRVRGTVEHALFAGLGALARARARTAQLHAAAEAVVVGQASPGVLVHARPHASGELVALHNLTADGQAVETSVVAGRGLREPVDRITGLAVSLDERQILLPPYGRLWLSDR